MRDEPTPSDEGGRKTKPDAKSTSLRLGPPTELSPRDLILEKVRRGEMTPEQAEAEAQRLGLRKFAGCPPKAQFNPMTETWWTFAMVVAWIAWRSDDGVRRAWDAYCRRCLDWHFREWRENERGPTYSGFF